MTTIASGNGLKKVELIGGACDGMIVDISPYSVSVTIPKSNDLGCTKVFTVYEINGDRAYYKKEFNTWPK